MSSPFMISTKPIRISLLGTQHDYKNCLLPLIAKSLGYKIAWVNPIDADLVIYGAFHKPTQKPYRWLPKLLRPHAIALENWSPSRKLKPLTLFHTCESLRHDTLKTDYSISFDLGVKNPKHLRLPYWMELVDWSHEGINGNCNPRYGQLLSIKRMQAPLGTEFLGRTQKAALITSHLLEPRRTLYEAVNNAVGVSGYGPHFDSAIKNHSNSYFTKKAILEKFAFNLCPENSLYPGYYTEKIPESFISGTLPLSWTDSNVCFDFNPASFINLEPMTWENYSTLAELLRSQNLLNSFASQPLLLNTPSLESAKNFIRQMLEDARS